jgi:hypothetical protein
MRKLLLILFLFCFYFSFGQNVVPRANGSITVQDYRVLPKYNQFIPVYADTTAANVQKGIDSLGAIIYTYDVHGLWVRVYDSGKTWTRVGGGSVSASEGLTISGDDVKIGGAVGAEAQLSVDRVINTMRKGMYWTNGTPIAASGGNVWQHTDKPYSPFQFFSADTLTSNEVDPPTAAVPLSGIFARRTMYYADGIYKTQKIYGHYLGQTFDWKDSMVFKTEGGDYNQGVTIEQRLKPRGTGKQVARSAHGTNTDLLAYYGTPTLLSNTMLVKDGTNYIYTRGWLVGISSYVVAGASSAAGADTISRFSYFQTNGFLNSSSKILKSYSFDDQSYTSGARVDSAFGLWFPYPTTPSHHAGSLSLGAAVDSFVTGYKFKVQGATYHRGLVQNFQGTDVASTAGVMTLNGTGNVYEITGTNTITAIANTNLKNGYEVTFVFTSTATLTDGTANSGANIGIELLGNANFTAAAGNTVTLVLSEIGGTQRWREISRNGSITARINTRYQSTTSAAQPTINTDDVDTYELTAQAADITSFTTNLSGTPTSDQKLHIIITGTAARAITWGASFEASTISLPSTTVSTDRLDVFFVWNVVTSKWRVSGSW